MEAVPTAELLAADRAMKDLTAFLATFMNEFKTVNMTSGTLSIKRRTFDRKLTLTNELILLCAPAVAALAPGAVGQEDAAIKMEMLYEDHMTVEVTLEEFFSAYNLQTQLSAVQMDLKLLHKLVCVNKEKSDTGVSDLGEIKNNLHIIRGRQEVFPRNAT